MGSGSGRPASEPGPKPTTVRIAAWSAGHRWPVLALWLVFTFGLFAASLIAGGTRSQAVWTSDQRAKFESAYAYDVFNGAGASEPFESVVLVVSSRTATVRDPGFAAEIADVVGRMTALQATADGVPGPAFASVVDPLSAPPAAGLTSADGTTVRIPGRVVGDGTVLRDRLAPIPGLVDALRLQHPDLTILPLSDTLASEQVMAIVNADLDGSLRVTIPLTFGILLLAFGALVAALVPLALAVSALLAAFGIVGLYSQVVEPISPLAPQLVVLIGLAVAVDYSLFLISRFRSEQRRGRGRLAAIEVASGTAGRAVFFSGLAVMISLAGLFILDDPEFRSMAVGTIAVVLVSVIGSLTFLPAVLSILGNRVNRGRVPFLGRERAEGTSLWSRLVGQAMNRPLVFAIGSAVLILAAASPTLRLQIGTSDITAYPETVDAVGAVQLMNDKWPAGTTLELRAVITHADEAPTQRALAELDRAILAIPGVSGPASQSLSGDRTVAMLSYRMAGMQNDPAGRAIVDRVRDVAVPAALASAPDARAYITGPVATALDEARFYENGMPLVLFFVLGLSFLLLLVAFRSIVIPLHAILLNLGSTAAAYGVLVLVFQEGWLGSQMGIRPGVIESFVPLFVFTILFGLSMDYHVLILTRIKEARDRGLDSSAAVAQGIAVSAGTITSAAAIMVAVFSVFVTLQIPQIRQLGLGLAVAVLLDATVVRSFLLPASMRLLGDWSWWLPRGLHWIPRVTLEHEENPALPAQA